MKTNVASWPAAISPPLRLRIFAVFPVAMQNADAAGMSPSDDNIEISQDGTMLTVRLTWVAPVNLYWYRYDLHFQIAERVPLR